MPDDRGYKLSENSSLVLDGLRIAASQAVVVGHGISYFQIWPSLQPPAFPYIQNLAVVVFFVLSGFLITYATLRKPPRFRFSEFFIDRFARIYSAYLVVLVLVLVVDEIALHVDPAKYDHAAALNWKTFVGNVFMLQDHPRPQVHQLFGLAQLTSLGSARPFWTLAVEWWIYMGFGWVVLRDRARSILVYLVVLAALVIVPASNILGGRGNGLGLVWIFGAAVYLLASARRLAAARADGLAAGALGFAALGAILLYRTKEPYDPRFGALLAATVLCTVLAVDRLHWNAPAVVVKAIRFLANYSFTLYLVHYTVLDLMAHHPVFDDATANFALAFVTTNAVAILVAYVTEFRHRELAGWLKRKLLSPQA